MRTLVMNHVERRITPSRELWKVYIEIEKMPRFGGRDVNFQKWTISAHCKSMLVYIFKKFPCRRVLPLSTYISWYMPMIKVTHFIPYIAVAMYLPMISKIQQRDNYFVNVSFAWTQMLSMRGLQLWLTILISTFYCVTFIWETYQITTLEK